MNDVRNAVARRDETQPTVVSVVQRLRPEIARALPKHMDADRMARIALTEIRKVPALGRCTPESFAGALLTASALGLEPGISGEAYLVPHGKEATLIVGYQGMAKLYYQSPLAQHLDSQAVHENDEFSYRYGTDPDLHHVPATGDRGAVIAYYAVAVLTTGARSFVVLSPDEVKALRGGKVGPSGKIADPMHWMERKTALRQLLKMLPKSAILARALDADERPGHELQQQLVQERAAQQAIEPAPEQPATADAPPPGVNTTTGEVVDGEVMDPTYDAADDPWAGK